MSEQPRPRTLPREVRLAALDRLIGRWLAEAEAEQAAEREQQEEKEAA